MLRPFLRALALTRPTELSLRVEACALCGFKVQVRLRRDEVAVRCAHCGASAITQSLVDVLLQATDSLADLDVYELSAGGPLVRWLRPRVRSLTTSEYFPDVPRGSERAGITCQDVQRLTYPDESFDLCMSTEVFEHVEDDGAGFREILRVLRPGGLHAFTVPLNLASTTLERTTICGGERVNVLPAEYHADRYRGQRVFCFRTYGADLAARLADVGYVDVMLRQPRQIMFGYARTVVCGRKPPQPLRQRSPPTAAAALRTP